MVASGSIRSVLKRKWIAPATIGKQAMPRLIVNVNHAYSANRPARKFGPTGRPIRDLDALIQDNEAREALIDPRVLSWIALLILVAGLVLALAWWRVIPFPH
jgi:hypothetical protein